MSTGAVLGWGTVPTTQPRRVFSAEIGEFFRSLRRGRKLGLRQAASIAQKMADKRPELRPLTRNTLQRLEKGRTKNPEPELLRAIASLYDIPFPNLLVAYIRERYQLSEADIDLLRPALGLEHGSDEVIPGGQDSGSAEASDRRVEPAHPHVSVGPTTETISGFLEVAAVLAELSHKVQSLSAALTGGQPAAAPTHQPAHAPDPRHDDRQPARAGGRKTR